MMEGTVLFVRHGNTFGAGDRVVWVGNSEDLPLTSEGEEQARALGAALRERGLVPDRFLVSPLKRTRRFAELLRETTGSGAELEFDDRLRELDYGSWGGLTNEEVESRWGRQALTDWSDRALRPAKAGWLPEEEAVVREVGELLHELKRGSAAGGTVCVVSSNGRLGTVHRLLWPAGEEWRPRERRLKTGHFGLARCAAEPSDKPGVSPGEGWRLLGWNLGLDPKSWDLKGQ